MVDVGVTVDRGCLSCSAGLGAGKSEDPDPGLPIPGKVNIDVVVGVPVVAGAGWLVGIENVDAGVTVVLEVVVVDGGGGEKKLGTAVVPVAVVEGSDFVVDAGEVIIVDLGKKFGTAGCAGTGIVFEDVGAGDGAAKRFFAGSLVSDVVASVAGFNCVEATEAGAGKLGVVVRVVDVIVAGAGAGQGFFSSSVAFFVS